MMSICFQRSVLLATFFTSSEWKEHLSLFFNTTSKVLLVNICFFSLSSGLNNYISYVYYETVTDLRQVSSLKQLLEVLFGMSKGILFIKILWRELSPTVERIFSHWENFLLVYYFNLTLCVSSILHLSMLIKMFYASHDTSQSMIIGRSIWQNHLIISIITACQHNQHYQYEAIYKHEM